MNILFGFVWNQLNFTPAHSMTDVWIRVESALHTGALYDGDKLISGNFPRASLLFITEINTHASLLEHYSRGHVINFPFQDGCL